MSHGNRLGNYSKYYPNQVRVDHDPQTGEIFRVAINSDGFRGREFSHLKSDGTIRVVTLGALSTFGYFDRDDQTYPYYMEQILNQECQSGQVFEVLNLGIPHLTSDQILSLFVTEALPLNPDVVTYYQGLNDAGRVELRTRRQDVRERLKQLSFISEFFKAVSDHVLSIALVDGLLTSLKRFSKDDFSNHIRGKSEYFLSNVSQVYKESQERNILFYRGQAAGQIETDNDRRHEGSNISRGTRIGKEETG